MLVPPTENGNDSYKAPFYNLSGCLSRWSKSHPTLHPPWFRRTCNFPVWRDAWLGSCRGWVCSRAAYEPSTKDTIIIGIGGFKNLC